MNNMNSVVFPSVRRPQALHPTLFCGTFQNHSLWITGVLAPNMSAKRGPALKYPHWSLDSSVSIGARIHIHPMWLWNVQRCIWHLVLGLCYCLPYEKRKACLQLQRRCPLLRALYGQRHDIQWGEHQQLLIHPCPARLQHDSGTDRNIQIFRFINSIWFSLRQILTSNQQPKRCVTCALLWGRRVESIERRRVTCTEEKISYIVDMNTCICLFRLLSLYMNWVSDAYLYWNTSGY